MLPTRGRATKDDLLMSENLAAVVAKISRVLAIKPECFITHPAELLALKPMSKAELNEFAAEHGWRAIRRVGGRQFEFYNDVSVGENLERRSMRAGFG